MTIPSNTKYAEQLKFSYPANGIANGIVLGTQFAIFLCNRTYPSV